MKRIFLCLLLMACNSPDLPKPIHNPTFNEYRAHLLSKYHIYTGATYNGQIHITFSNHVDDAEFREPPNQIFVNQTYWDSINETERRIVLLHEFGHQLGRSHLDVFINDRPTSIMFGGGLLNDDYFLEHEDYYMKELFK